METQIQYNRLKGKEIQIQYPDITHGTRLLHYTTFDIPAGTTLPFMAHWHPEYEIIWQLDDFTEFQVDGNLYHIDAGEALFLNGNCVHGHANPSLNYGHYLCFSFGEEFLFPDCNSHIYNRFFMPIQSGQYTFTKLITSKSSYEREILSILNKLAGFSKNILDNALSIQICLLSIFEIMLRENAFSRCDRNITKQELIKTALWYINQNYTSPISIQEISDFLNLSANHFCRLFKSAVGFSPKDYIQNMRIRHAIHEMTAHPDYRLAEIALMAGFSEPNYFSRVFKDRVGMSPSDYHKHIFDTSSRQA